MVGEANAAIEGALAGGATEVAGQRQPRQRCTTCCPTDPPGSAPAPGPEAVVDGRGRRTGRRVRCRALRRLPRPGRSSPRDDRPHLHGPSGRDSSRWPPDGRVRSECHGARGVGRAGRPGRRRRRPRRRSRRLGCPGRSGSWSRPRSATNARSLAPSHARRGSRPGGRRAGRPAGGGGRPAAVARRPAGRRSRSSTPAASRPTMPRSCPAPSASATAAFASARGRPARRLPRLPRRESHGQHGRSMTARLGRAARHASVDRPPDRARGGARRCLGRPRARLDDGRAGTRDPAACSVSRARRGRAAARRRHRRSLAGRRSARPGRRDRPAVRDGPARVRPGAAAARPGRRVRLRRPRRSRRSCCASPTAALSPRPRHAAWPPPRSSGSTPQRTARRETIAMLGEAPRPWLGATLHEPDEDGALDGGADAHRCRASTCIRIEVPIGRELADAADPTPGSRYRTGSPREGVVAAADRDARRDPAPTGSQRGDRRAPAGRRSGRRRARAAMSGWPRSSRRSARRRARSSPASNGSI